MWPEISDGPATKSEQHASVDPIWTKSSVLAAIISTDLLPPPSLPLSCCQQPVFCFRSPVLPCWRTLPMINGKWVRKKAKGLLMQPVLMIIFALEALWCAPTCTCDYSASSARSISFIIDVRKLWLVSYLTVVCSFFPPSLLCLKLA